MRKRCIITLCLISFVFTQISNGYYLFSPVISFPEENQLFSTFLIDTSGAIIHQWTHTSPTASTPYLLPDSTLLRPYKIDPPMFDAGGAGGMIEILSWGNEILWRYEMMDTESSQHHDIEPLLNGNILILSWDKKSQVEAIAAGKSSHTGNLWSEKIIEIEPIYPDSGIVVWEWFLWDHLIQDHDESIDNYGNISENSGLLDINYALLSNEGPLPPQFTNPDMIHLNAIDYNQGLDQIIFSSRKTHEIYIIDHSVSTQIAEGAEGDFLYRWGNPSIYESGNSNNQVLYAPHSVNWSSDNEIIIFNNGVNRPSGNYSSVEIVSLPLFEDGSYFQGSGNPFMPISSTFTYNMDEEYFTASQGGAFKLSDGNLLVTIANMKTILELNPSGEIVFEYYYNGNGNLPRSKKYNSNYLSPYSVGDVNSDYYVNILDVIDCLNIILTNSLYYESADINQDNIIDILDILLIINIILI